MTTIQEYIEQRWIRDLIEAIEKAGNKISFWSLTFRYGTKGKYIPEEILHHFWGQNYNMASVSAHVSMDFIDNHPSNAWDFNSISSNRNLTPDFIKRNLDKDWDFTNIGKNPALTFQDFLDNPEIPRDFDGISRNPNVTLDIIEQNINLPWSYYYIVDNPNLTMEFVEKYLDQFKEEYETIIDIENGDSIYNKIIRDLSNNDYFEFPDEIIDKHFKEISYITFTYNKHLKFQTILKYKDRNWAWCELTRHPNITMDDIFNNLDLPWQYSNIEENPNFHVKYILDNPNLVTDFKKLRIACNIFESISKHPSVTPEIVESHPDVIWSSFGLYQNPNFTLEKLASMPQVKVHPGTGIGPSSFYSLNHNLTFKYIDEHPEMTWNFELIFGGVYSGNNNLIIQREISRVQAIKEWFALKKIKFCWIRSRYHGDYQIARKYVMEDYMELFREQQQTGYNMLQMPVAPLPEITV